MKTNYMVLIFLCSFSLVKAQAKHSDSLRNNILSKIVSIQYEYDKLREIQSFLLQDSIEYIPENYSKYKELLVNPNWGIVGKDSSLDQYGITFYYLSTVTRTGINIEFLPPHFYIVAMGKDGSIFLIKGFWRNDFNSLIKKEIKLPLNNIIALKLGLFYLNYVIEPSISTKFIDSTFPSSELIKLNKKLYYPKLYKDRQGNYQISVCAIEYSNNVNILKRKLFEYNLLLSKEGKFSFLNKSKLN